MWVKFCSKFHGILQVVPETLILQPFVFIFHISSRLVLSYYPKKKIGYLTDQKGADVFYRVSQWKGGGDPLARDGQPVKYVIVVDERGPRATNIHIHDGSNYLGNFPDDIEHPNDVTEMEGIHFCWKLQKVCFLRLWMKMID